MPEDGITVYGKWVQIQYRVFLDPDVPTSEKSFAGDPEADPPVPDGLGGQSTSFRIAYGDSIDPVDGIRDYYELIGWYTDDDELFSFDAYVMNESVPGLADYDTTRSTETDVYGKTGSESIDPDKYPDTNKDKTEKRFWITKSLDLKAK